MTLCLRWVTARLRVWLGSGPEAYSKPDMCILGSPRARESTLCEAHTKPPLGFSSLTIFFAPRGVGGVKCLRGRGCARMCHAYIVYEGSKYIHLRPVLSRC